MLHPPSSRPLSLREQYVIDVEARGHDVLVVIPTYTPRHTHLLIFDRVPFGTGMAIDIDEDDDSWTVQEMTNN